MARPGSKSDLLVQAKENYERLIDYVEGLSEEELEQDFPEGTLNMNSKDVLARLHSWHLLLLDWYTIGMSGEEPDMPARGYTWRMLPELNGQIQQRYSKVGLDDIKGLLRASYSTVYKIIEAHTDEDLFTKKKYHWTGSTSLAAYVISATCSHYDWGYKLIKSGLNG
ncbi:ClbS/DfsB family four-helix bundle protein [Flavobacteriaceae bacterium GF1]